MLNGVLCGFQHYLSHITAAAHIFMCFLGFYGSEKSWPKDNPTKSQMDPMRFEPCAYKLQVLRFTNEARRTFSSQYLSVYRPSRLAKLAKLTDIMMIIIIELLTVELNRVSLRPDFT